VISVAGAIVLCEIGLFVAALALTARRLHDRGKRMWWIAVLLFATWALDYAAMSINYACAQSSLPLFAILNLIAYPVACAGLPLAGTSIPVWMVSMPVAGFAAALAALAFTVWSFVELCVLSGVRGDNRFGPDPRANLT
jgi:uncharacterized membrane protein YhaH (DUF805 family)